MKWRFTKTKTIAKLKKSQPNACADQFIAHLLTPEAQSVISRKNVMLPVISREFEPHFEPQFNALKKQQFQVKSLDAHSVNEQKIKEWTGLWQRVLSQ